MSGAAYQVRIGARPGRDTRMDSVSSNGMEPPETAGLVYPATSDDPREEHSTILITKGQAVVLKAAQHLAYFTFIIPGIIMAMQSAKTGLAIEYALEETVWYYLVMSLAILASILLFFNGLTDMQEKELHKKYMQLLPAAVQDTPTVFLVAFCMWSSWGLIHVARHGDFKDGIHSVDYFKYYMLSLFVGTIGSIISIHNYSTMLVKRALFRFLRNVDEYKRSAEYMAAVAVFTKIWQSGKGIDAFLVSPEYKAAERVWAEKQMQAQRRPATGG